MKALKIFLVYIKLALVIGLVPLVISLTLLEGQQSTILVPVGYLSAFIGSGSLFGFKNYKDRPKYIGNFEDDLPYINQTYAFFFISLILNLTVIGLI